MNSGRWRRNLCHTVAKSPTKFTNICCVPDLCLAAIRRQSLSGSKSGLRCAALAHYIRAGAWRLPVHDCSPVLWPLLPAGRIRVSLLGGYFSRRSIRRQTIALLTVSELCRARRTTPTSTTLLTNTLTKSALFILDLRGCSSYHPRCDCFARIALSMTAALPCTVGTHERSAVSQGSSFRCFSRSCP